MYNHMLLGTSKLALGKPGKNKKHGNSEVTHSDSSVAHWVVDVTFTASRIPVALFPTKDSARATGMSGKYLEPHRLLNMVLGMSISDCAQTSASNQRVCFEKTPN